jgi:putative pyruvate formate lyase activating enzyme
MPYSPAMRTITLSATKPSGRRASDFEPCYLRLHRSGELARCAQEAREHMKDCDLCARYCHVNRLETSHGAACRTSARAVVHSFGPHHGEEDCLRGWNGSGTVFFSWCNLCCDYCQNWDISWRGEGNERSAEELASMMLKLQEMGCHNINFVSPSHVVAQILEAVAIAAGRGLRLPLVYNTGGYDSLEALALLEGVIDIYMPDMKYGDSAKARRHSHVRDYVEFNRKAVKEMHRQVGDLVIGEEGVGRRGLLVRHLILPNDIAGTNKVLKFLAEEISADTYVNLMDQYRPCYRAGEVPELGRPITSTEFEHALDVAKTSGLRRPDLRISRSRFAGL